MKFRGVVGNSGLKQLQLHRACVDHIRHIQLECSCCAREAFLGTKQFAVPFFPSAIFDSTSVTSMSPTLIDILLTHLLALVRRFWPLTPRRRILEKHCALL